jgi:hypothetical protein
MSVTAAGPAASSGAFVSGHAVKSAAGGGLSAEDHNVLGHYDLGRTVHMRPQVVVRTGIHSPSGTAVRCQYLWLVTGVAD